MKRKLRTHLLKTIICETTSEAAAGVHHHPRTAGLVPDAHHGALTAEFTPHTAPCTRQGPRHRAHTATRTARLRRQGSRCGAHPASDSAGPGPPHIPPGSQRGAASCGATVRSWAIHGGSPHPSLAEAAQPPADCATAPAQSTPTDRSA